MSIGIGAQQFLWLLLSLPFILILHFIRARANPLPVSALFLWEEARALAQQKRRFSATWLLLLQLLAASLLTLTLARPFIKTEAKTAKIIILDTSASMSSQTTSANQTSRLDLAKAEIRTLLEDSQEVALIKAGLDAQVIAPLTNNPSDITEALNAITATDRHVNLNRALQLAASLKDRAELHLFSDNISTIDLQAFTSEGHTITTHVITDDAINVGISAFELRGNQAFVSVVSNYQRPQQLELNLYLDDAFVGQTPMLVPRNGQMHWSFPIQQKAGTYKAEIIAPEWDALALDNTAYALSRDLKVLISPPEPSFERAFLAIPNIDIRISNRVNGVYDLLITNEMPSRLEPGNYIFYNSRLESPDYQRIADWDAADDFLRFSDLSGARVGLNPSFKLPTLYNTDRLQQNTDADAPTTNDTILWQTIIQSGGLEPIMVYSKAPQAEAVVFNFHPSQSDLVRRSAFPILVANVIRNFGQEKRLPLGSFLAGENIIHNGEAYDSDYATLPGIYSIDGQNYSSSLLSREESSLAVGDVVSASTQAQTDGSSNNAITNTSQSNIALEDEATSERTFTEALLLLALILITLEWLFWALRGGWTFRDLFRLRPTNHHT